MKTNGLKKYAVFTLVAVIAGLLYWGCSEDQNPLPSQAHSDSWMDQQSEDFHGKKVATLRFKDADKDYDGYESCKSCHGGDLRGGESEVSCFGCHGTYPHPDEWMIISNANFHGKFLVSGEGQLAGCASCHGVDYQGGSSEVACTKCHASYPHVAEWMNVSNNKFHGTYLSSGAGPIEACQNCHGVDYQGGSSEVACYTCHASYPHPQEWMAVSNDKFHGEFLRAVEWSTESCQGCHGVDYAGGSSEVSCFTCHAGYPHAEAWLTKGNTDFHGNFIRQDNWSMNSCKDCHGADYLGGTSGASCNTCHTGDAGPETCNVCHGNAGDANHPYPPEDLSGNTATTALGVGAHEIHMQLFNDCTLCHNVPATFDATTHIDAPPAEVNATWTWDRNAGTCASSCHGAALVWNNF